MLVCMAAGPGRPQQQQAQQGGAAASRAPVEGSSAAAGGGSGAGGGAAADHRGLGGTAAEEEGLEAASHWRSQARWWWRCRLRCWALRGLSGVCWCLCGATVAAELSIRPPSGLPNLSVFAAALRRASAAAGADVSSLLTQLASFLFLGCVCFRAQFSTLLIQPASIFFFACPGGLQHKLVLLHFLTLE